MIAEIASEMININDKITKIDLNRAMSTYFKAKKDILLIHNTNSFGAYKLQNEKRVDGKRQRVTLYFLQVMLRPSQFHQIPLPLSIPQGNLLKSQSC